MFIQPQSARYGNLALYEKTENKDKFYVNS